MIQSVPGNHLFLEIQDVPDLLVVLWDQELYWELPDSRLYREYPGLHYSQVLLCLLVFPDNLGLHLCLDNQVVQQDQHVQLIPLVPVLHLLRDGRLFLEIREVQPVPDALPYQGALGYAKIDFLNNLIKKFSINRLYQGIRDLLCAPLVQALRENHLYPDNRELRSVRVVLLFQGNLKYKQYECEVANSVTSVTKLKLPS